MSTELAPRWSELDATSSGAEATAISLPTMALNPSHWKTTEALETTDTGVTTSSNDGAQLLEFSVPRLDAPTSQLVAEWHGEVTAILDVVFVAELRGVVGAGVHGSREEAEIPIDEVRPDDRELMVPGAFFRLSINYEFQPNSLTRRRYTDITFRRLPAYRRHDLEAAAQRGRDLARAIRME